MQFSKRTETARYFEVFASVPPQQEHRHDAVGEEGNKQVIIKHLKKELEGSFSPEDGDHEPTAQLLIS